MTAEIAILNKHAVALAADSALTIGRGKVWKTANKLFSLGPKHDIGMMMYGSADYLSFPWEVLLKQFRAYSQKVDFLTLKDCREAFLSFIKSETYRDAKFERDSVLTLFIKIMDMMKDGMDYTNSRECSAQIIELSDSFLKSAEARIVISELSYADFSKIWSDDILQLCKEIFKHMPTKSALKKLQQSCHVAATTKFPSGHETGIVIAGFGAHDIFPHVLSIVFDGRHGDCCRIWDGKGLDMNIPENRAQALVAPFAQDDIIHILMEGISKQYIKYLRRVQMRVLEDKSDALIDAYIADPDERIVEKGRQKGENDKIMEKFERGFSLFRQKSLVQPVMKAIQSLPKEEMAAMAEALVEITSLKRRVDSPLESVGGPVDVAVISKGDGFIWIKRKHYFSAEINKDFLYRKRGQAGDMHND